MKTQHWTGFSAFTTSKVDGFYGGIYPTMNFSNFSNLNSFGAFTYRLRVSETHNGWHHFLAMYSAIQGISFSNACVKEACRPGDYQFVFHLDNLRPYVANGPNSNLNSWTQSFMYAQDINGHSTSKNSFSSEVVDAMVIRPMLVDPTNANNFYYLWNTSNALYQGIQPYFTGIPFADPSLSDGSANEL